MDPVTPPDDKNPNAQDPNPEAPPPSKPEGGDAAAPATAVNESQVREALKALADIQQRWANQQTPASTQNDVEKIREQIKERTGWTDDQIDFHQQSMINAVAPLREQMSWMQLEKSHPDLSRYKDAMEKELADGYTPAQRSDPRILEKIYYLAKGRAMEQQPPSSRPAGQAPKPAPAYQGMGGGTDTGSRPSDSGLTAEQKEYARRLGVGEEAYKKSIGVKTVETAETRKAREPRRAVA